MPTDFIETVATHFVASSGATAPFYLIWGGLHFTLHIIWDLFSKKTPPFGIADLRSKMDEFFASATFASSLYLLLILWRGEWDKLGAEAAFPLCLATGAGLLVSLSALQPYPSERAIKKAKEYQEKQKEKQSQKANAEAA
ncbi:MAG: hypothetical protein CMH98_03705 [Oceanospirillaceae bacterium]|nr:hypothetical protein [Oceanospirillaceae bacterium]